MHLEDARHIKMLLKSKKTKFKDSNFKYEPLLKESLEQAYSVAGSDLQASCSLQDKPV